MDSKDIKNASNEILVEEITNRNFSSTERDEIKTELNLIDSMDGLDESSDSDLIDELSCRNLSKYEKSQLLNIADGLDLSDYDLKVTDLEHLQKFNSSSLKDLDYVFFEKLSITDRIEWEEYRDNFLIGK